MVCYNDIKLNVNYTIHNSFILLQTINTFFLFIITATVVCLFTAYIQRKPPTDPCSSLFVQSFLSCFPCVISPVVLLRLLLHRLLTTAAHLQRWKSCASRSSFASASVHDVPRSPRSRASSTDTEPSTLRKRRKV